MQKDNSLPDECFSVRELTGELIKIKNGEKGFYPIKDKDLIAGYRIKYNAKDNNELADRLNEINGITKQQRLILECRSM